MYAVAFKFTAIRRELLYFYYPVGGNITKACWYPSVKEEEEALPKITACAEEEEAAN